LLNKLQQIGIRSQPNKWFESYLKDRSQFVQILNFKSQHAMIKHRVLQGTVLGLCYFWYASMIYQLFIQKITLFYTQMT